MPFRLVISWLIGWGIWANFAWAQPVMPRLLPNMGGQPFAVQVGLAQQIRPRLLRGVDKPAPVHAVNEQMYQDARGQLWLASLNGVLRFDGQRFHAYPGPPGRYYHVTASPDGRIWCKRDAGYSISYIDPRPDRMVPIPDTTRFVREYIAKQGCHFLYPDAEGNLWIGQRGGVLKVNLRTYAAEPVFRQIGADVRCVTQDRRGMIWFTSNYSVYAYDPATRRLRHFTHDPAHVATSLSKKMVLGIHARQDGLILVDMSDEIDTIDPVTGTVRQLLLPDPPNQLRYPPIFDFAEDRAGNVYFCTKRGPYRYTRQGELQRLAFGRPVQYLFPTRDGRLWVDTERSLAEYDLSRVRAAPALHLLDVVAGGTRIEGYNVDQRLTRDTLGHPTLTVQDRDSLQLELSSRVGRGAARFRYRLLPAESRWTVVDTPSALVNYQLPGGTYILALNASDAAGKGWEPTAATLTIVVTTPYWRTVWFWALVLALVGGSGYWAFRSWTRRQRLQQELARRAFEAATLREVDQVKSRFFANVTHEFRTPLTIILNATEQLAATSPALGQPPQLATIQRHAQQLLRLITETLDMGRLDAAKLEPHDQLGDPVAFIGEVVAQFSGLAGQSGIVLTYQAEESASMEVPGMEVPGMDVPNSSADGLYRFDGDKWEKIAYNLLANALKFTPAGGRVRVTGQLIDGKRFVLRVADTGIGIPADQLSRIFERFHQVDASSTRAYSGTGIGLALVKELTDWLGGTVAVESEEGRGSVFTVALPLTRPTAGQLTADRSMPAEPALPRLRPAPALPVVSAPVNGARVGRNGTANGTDKLILLVEDNADLRAQVVDYLSAEYRVLAAPNGQLGLEQAVAKIPDLIVSDVMMPELDGFQLVERLKADERTSHIPVILLTARSSPDSRLKGLQAGADDYLGKPFSLAELVLRIGNGLRTRQNWQKRFLSQAAPNALAPPSEPDREAQFLNRLRRAILDHIETETLDVDWLADQAGMSRTQLHRKLTALTSLSPNRFIHRVRLERAAELLQTGEMNVAQVSYAVGYSSQSYFAKVFQEHFGYAPARLKR